jgi:hypothetical protein
VLAHRKLVVTCNSNNDGIEPAAFLALLRGELSEMHGARLNCPMSNS